MAKKKAELSQSTATDDFSPDCFAIRTCAADGTSYGTFKWPLEIGAIVTCPDWKPAAECGNGLHGLIDGVGAWSLVDGSAGRVWLVVGVLRSEVVTIDDGKGKFPRAKIAYVGSSAGAFGFIQRHTVAAIQKLAQGSTATGDRGHAAATGDSGHAAATGDSGHAAATGYSSHAAATGYSGHAAATGYSGHAAATGDRGHAAATGYRGHAAATGYRGHAAATGYSGHAAATGKHSIAASLGVHGTAQGAPDTWLVLAAHDEDYNLVCVKVAKIGGPEGLKPDTPYRLTPNGEFVEAAQ